MTEAEILAAAAKDMRASTITVREWMRRARAENYPWEETHIGDALLTLEKVKKVTEQRPGGGTQASPPMVSLQRTIFWANVTDDAVQHACRLGTTWRHALTADPAYTPTVEQVNALKAASAGVDVWANQTEIPFPEIDTFRSMWHLDRIILQAETIGEFASGRPAAMRLIGNPNAWTHQQRREAAYYIGRGSLAVTAEVYDGRPDTYSAQGVPVSSFTLGVALDSGLRYPLADLLTKTPAGARSGVCIWHGNAVLLDEADRAALMAL